MGVGTVYGLLTIDRVEVALPLDLLREVIPAPADYQPVPMTARGLLGTIVLRGLIVPVIDVADRMSDRPRPVGGEEQVIAIVVQDDRVVGILADGVCGVADVAAGRLQRLAVNGGERPVFSACFNRPDTAVVTSVLDGEALFSLPGIPVASRAAWAVAGGRDVDGDGEPRDDDGAAMVMLFAVGGSLFGLDVAHVTTVLPDIELRSSVLDGALCRGVTAHLDLHIPVADPLALTGFGALAADEVRQGVVLGLERGFVALALSEMHAVVRVPRQDVRPLPALGVTQVERFAGLVTAEDGRHYLLLDGERLARDPDLDTLSALNTAAVGADGGDATAGPAVAAGDAPRSGAGASYLTYDIGAAVATPLEEVSEILAYPTDLVTAASSRPEVIATFVHRGAATPLVDLAALLRPVRPRPVGPDARVLVVQVRGVTIGFAVADLHAIERSAWEAEREGDAPTSAPDLLASAPLIEIVTDGQQRLVPRVSLTEAAVHLLPSVGSDTSPPAPAPVEVDLTEPSPR